MSVMVRAGLVLLESELVPDAWLEHEGGVIIAVGRGAPPRAVDLELPAATLAPGFVDLHCHGAVGSAFDDDEPDWDAMLGLHTAHGTTRQAASLVSAPA